MAMEEGHKPAFRTPVGKVRGLGAAKSGTHHWWLQRVTALSNLALIMWFIASLVSNVAGGYPTVISWMSQPIVAVLLVALVISVFIHFRLGLREIVEDYVHSEGNKVALLLLIDFYAIGGALIAIFSIMKVAF